MLERQYARTGVMPAALQNQPKLQGHLMWVFDSFTLLSGFRTWRDGIPDPISLANILLYLDETEVFSSAERPDFTYLITQMDSAFMNHFITKQKQEMDKLKRKNK